MENIQKRISKTGEISYRVQVRLKGHPAQTASFKRLTDAKTWERHTKTEIQQGRHFQSAEGKKHTLGEANHSCKHKTF